MFTASQIDASDLTRFYAELDAQLAALLTGERDVVANAANTSALIFQLVADLNWAGFYLLKSSDELVVGPFQGKPACVRIPVGKGVCGATVERRASILVEDVHAFPGHIACDANSQSELVVPLLLGERILGVLDLDSPVKRRFGEADRIGFERLAKTFVEACDW
ncbi:GAF domain-containing protein [Pseudochelatococcus contaminans]|uniref:GAF domain-containing protein n=1 Tax=Pseudochelatococcus contaminans TaxID=1538103 RepID=A0A7W5Z2P4_9HYPH|nr:GAF domain-containing protein [Pseudochelatococcus contaminans]MBB3808977.1 GAF domain-containing protein [Pseudochelatococcus contaminans]